MPRLLLTIVVLLGLFASTAARAAETGQVFRAGAFALDITPTKFPVQVGGSFTGSTADKAFDPLHARALVLDDGHERVAIVIVDVAGMPRTLIDDAKGVATKATGIRTDRMLIAPTHTHAAPAIVEGLSCPTDAEYAAFLVPLLARSIQLALEQLRPAQVGWTAVKDPQHTGSRSRIRRSDKMDVNPFGEKVELASMYAPWPESIGPSGPVDDEISLLALQTIDGKPLALLANYATHYYGHPAVSADYYGRFCSDFAALVAPQQREPAFVAMMSQGTSGDVQGGGAGNIDNYSQEVAAVAFKAYQTISYQTWVPLVMREVEQTFDRRVPDAARLAWARQINESIGGRKPETLPEIYAREQILSAADPQGHLKLQALRIGDLGIAAIPNEVYSLTGIKIKLQSPLAQTFTIELANGAEGYLPPPEQIKLGGYTTWPTRNHLGMQSEPQMVEASLSLLEQVSGKPRKPIEKPQSAYAAAVLRSKPSGYWQLDELSGRQAADASENNHAAVYEEGVAFYLEGPAAAGFPTAGWGNRCAHFAGGRMKANVPDIAQTYSAEFWFWNGFPNDVRAVTGYLFSRGPEGNRPIGDHLGIGGTPTEQGRLFFSSGGRSDQLLSDHTVIQPGTWNHVVLVRDGKQVRVYLNGKSQPELSGEVELSPAEPGGSFFFAGRNDNVTGLEGKLDEAAIYGRALSAEEVGAHFTASGMPVAPK